MPSQSDLRYSFQPLVGKAEFEVVSFTLAEALSTPFTLTLELVSDQANVDFGQLLDQPVLFTVWRGDQAVRHVHGLVSRFTLGDSGFRRTRYRAVVEPQLARAGLRSNWRIFQFKTVPQILEILLKAQGLTDFEISSSLDHPQREFCVQADETDLAFIARLAAEEGYLYRFEHSAKGHRLVMTDQLLGMGWLAGEREEDDQAPPCVRYQPNAGGDRPQPALRTLSYSEQVRTARQVQRDYTFKHPRYHQEHIAAASDLEHQGRHYERFDYPGRYKRDAVGKPATQRRMTALRHDVRLVDVVGDDLRLQPGLSFNLASHPREDLNVHWRVKSVTHTGSQFTSLQEESAGAEQGTHYEQHAVLIPGRIEWKPEPLAKPRIDGPHMAIVVGPPDEEIYCDEWGRVKVSFPWDRESRDNEFSSCWVRVAQGWAGGSWGSMAIPRIGQEVIVQYLGADPDQPLITGRTYCATQLPPYELPKHKTRMTIKSHTHKGDGFNELRFEDELGRQEVFIHAEKDQNNVVRNDETTYVGHDRCEEVVNDEHLKVGRDRTQKVERDELTFIGQDKKQEVARNYSLIVREGQESITKMHKVDTVEMDRHDRTGNNHHIATEGNTRQEVAGEYQLKVGRKIQQETQELVLKAGQRIVIQSQGASIVLDDSGITFNALSLTFKGKIVVPEGATEGNSWWGSGKPASGPLEEYFVLQDAATGAPLPDHPYEIIRASGHVLRGLTAADGKTQRVNTAEAETLVITALENPEQSTRIEACYWDELSGADLDFSSERN